MLNIVQDLRKIFQSVSTPGGSDVEIMKKKFVLSNRFKRRKEDKQVHFTVLN
jgi:hypothetical protein